MKITIEQIRSPIRRPGSKPAKLRLVRRPVAKPTKLNRPSSQRATLIGLGLKRIGRAVEVEDTPQIRGMIAKVAHLIRVYHTLTVTFDSNAYQRAVNPARFPHDPAAHEIRKINAALKDGRIVGYLSETVATLEGVRNSDRRDYFANVTPKIQRAAKLLPEGQIKLGHTVEADNTLHPGLAPKAVEWITAATSLGLRFLRAPRLGGPRPQEVLANFAKDGTGREPQERLDRFASIVRAIEARGVGIARIKEIGERSKARIGFSGPWYAALAGVEDPQELKELEKAVGEWVDGDTVAAHVAYGMNVLCTEDQAKSAGAPSIFDQANRKWLQEMYGARILSLRELAAELDK